MPLWNTFFATCNNNDVGLNDNMWWPISCIYIIINKCTIARVFNFANKHVSRYISDLLKILVKSPDETARLIFQRLQAGKRQTRRNCVPFPGVDGFRVPQTVEFHQRRPTRRQGVAKPRFSSGTSGANSFFVFSAILLVPSAAPFPLFRLLEFSSRPQDFFRLCSDRQFAWTAPAW